MSKQLGGHRHAKLHLKISKDPGKGRGSQYLLLAMADCVLGIVYGGGLCVCERP